MFWLIKMWLGSLNWTLIPEATVGLDTSCRYQPDELAQALIENQLVYITNEFTISGLYIEQDNIHLIGGFDSCAAIKLRIPGLRKTKISGAHETVALKVNSSELGSVVLENFEISEGYSNYAGGIQVIQANQFKLKNSLIHNNVSASAGGGIHISGSGVAVELRESKIFNNTAKNVGGGITISGEYNTLFIQETLVYANHAGIAGGGMSCLNHNQINVLTEQAELDLWLINNISPLAGNLYYDLSCQINRSSTGRFGLNE